jgi:hypothetical protein
MRFRPLLALILVPFVFGVIAPLAQPAHAATKSSRDFSSSVKKAAKKKPVATKERVGATPNSVGITARLNSEPVDPMASEPSEAIMAIKNRAERTYWEGRKTPAQKQAEWDSGQTVDAQSLQRTSASEITGVTFYDQPMRMPASEAFQRSLNTVAFELGTPCRTQEYLGWPLGQSEQARVDVIFSDTMDKLKARGYSITPRNPRAAGTDVSVFTGNRRATPVSKNVLGLWSAGDVGLLLLLCETEPEKKPFAATTKSKSKAAVKPKKKSAKRPQVIPGAAKHSDKAVKPASEATAPNTNAPTSAFNPEAPPALIVEEQKPEPTPVAEEKPAEVKPEEAKPAEPAPAPPPAVEKPAVEAPPAPTPAPEAAKPVEATPPAAAPAPPSQMSAPPSETPPSDDKAKADELLTPAEPAKAP